MLQILHHAQHCLELPSLLGIEEFIVCVGIPIPAPAAYGCGLTWFVVRVRVMDRVRVRVRELAWFVVVVAVG